MDKRCIITGNCGFIGSALTRYLHSNTNWEIIGLDKLTYAASELNVLECQNSDRYKFFIVDVANLEILKHIFCKYNPDYVFHLAASSHVDRSIADPLDFLNTNIIGTYNILEAIRWCNTKPRLLHVSTDEVYGSLEDHNSSYFKENFKYQPNSPYSASKASSDHLVRAWVKTYGIDAIITNCSNNYGPYQYPEKLIPKTIVALMNNEQISIHGDGSNIRDWLHVDDHVHALKMVIEKGNSLETYNIGDYNEFSNLEVVKFIIKIYNSITGCKKTEKSISFVEDRPGNDKRYAINSTKIREQIGWEPLIRFDNGIFETVKWYLNNNLWVEKMLK